MRLTIERLRTIVLLAGVLLVIVLGVFLTLNKYRNAPLNRKDVPHRLGADVQQESNGFTYSHALGAHAQYEIHASKLIQLRQGNRVLLHDVKIDLYGADGSQVDRIEGGEFEYDEKAGLAKASGPVVIKLSRPGVAPAVAPRASAGRALSDKANPLTAAAANAARGEIDVQTSGLVFNQNTGVATTDEPVRFSTLQGSGSAVGATYDSKGGLLVLQRSVQLDTHRGNQRVQIRAERAELERGDQLCRLEGAAITYPKGLARANSATVTFRSDGSAQRLEAKNGFSLATNTGGRMESPVGWLEFDKHNQPQQGWMQDGVIIDSKTDRGTIHGTSPTLALKFSATGLLRSAHLERGVRIESDENTLSDGVPGHSRRSWSSPVADLVFRSERGGRIELASIHGTQGVKITALDQRGTGPSTPSTMSADDVTGTFGADSALTGLVGVGHAHMEQTRADGTRQDVSGDRLTAHFRGETAVGGRATQGSPHRGVPFQVQSATVDGHVVLVQQPAAKPGAGPASVLRATAERAVDEGEGEWLHLTGEPRVVDGGLELTAVKIDVSQTRGTALAMGDVKTTWLGNGGTPANGTARGGASQAPTFGGQGPSHAIAARAELQQKSGEAVFQGHARLWQQANSITAPTIILNRAQQSVLARTASPGEPVRVVLLRQEGTAPRGKAKSNSPSVIRLRGGEFKYSAAERKAVMKGGVEGAVAAEANDATMISNEMELILAPPGNHAGKDGGEAQVERITALGNVTVESEGRKGMGEKLAYSGDTGEYTLTGSAAVPPRMIDPTRGAVTGEALIFNSRDDSVRVEEGGGNSTVSSKRKQ